MTRLLPLLLLAGCVLGSDRYARPRDLPSAWHIDRVRVLAVAPEPPEAAPGDTVTFTALIADPEEEVQTVVWLACDPGSASGFGCSPDFADLPEDPTREDLEERGVIGISPFLPPVYEVPEDLLDGLSEAEARAGLQVTVQVLALPALEDDELDDFDFNEVEAAFKRLVVSDKAVRNQNPVVTGVVVSGTAVPAGAVIELDRGLEYAVTVSLQPESIEAYTYINSDGELEDRVEEPYVTLFATDGQMAEQYGLYRDDPVLHGPRWQAPDEADAEGTLYLVVRDRRGGMAFTQQSYRVR